MNAKLRRFAEQLAEHRNDPVWFWRNVLEREPHPGQQKWLINAHCDENMIVTGNQWGKSEVAAGGLIRDCAYQITWTPEMRARMKAMHQYYHGINISITADQSRLVWFKAHSMLQGPKASWLVKSYKMTPFPRIEFINGAILEARSTSNNGERLLGNIYDRVNWDEAAYEKKFSYILENVLRMRMVARAGRLTYTSTGNGRNDFGQQFLKGLEGKDPDLYCQTGPTWKTRTSITSGWPRTPPVCPSSRRQNILGEIVDGGGAFFPNVDIDAAIDTDLDLRVLEWDDEDREEHAIVYVNGEEWVAKYPGHRYIHGWDIANEQDWTVGTTWDVTTSPKTLVEFERFHQLGWSHNYQRMRVRENKYAQSETYLDATGIGGPVLEELSDIDAVGVIFSDNQARTGKKSEMLTNVQSLLSTRQLRIPFIKVLLEELRWYEREDKGLVKDCVMSVAIAGEGMMARGEFSFSQV